jgi:16S rRNA (cytosine1402-N4)-methyltransferase
MPTPEERHQPVMLDECLDALSLRKGKCYVDGTLGMGGHSQALLSAMVKLGDTSPCWVGVDQDAHALAMAKARLTTSLSDVKMTQQLHFLQANYSEIAERLPVFTIEQIDGGLLLDLGVSSYQLDTPERGFSFMRSSPLDMRMDSTNPNLMTAEQLINTATPEELRAYPIVQAIVEDRTTTPWKDTLALANLVERVYSAKQKGKPHSKESKHPATRTFQALRMAVNRELEHLETLLNSLPQLMAPGSRVAIMTFHSLEDRLVKQTFKAWLGGCTCPPRHPICTCKPQAYFEQINRKPIEASPLEVELNPRSRSAKLRVYERIIG